MNEDQFFRVEEKVVRKITERQIYRLRFKAVLFCLLFFVGAVSFLPAYNYMFIMAEKLGAVPIEGIIFLIIMLSLCVYSARRFIRELQVSRMSVA